MRQQNLAIILSRLQEFTDPDPELEQYATPPDIAAAVANQVRLSHEPGRVVDLGCGTGILSIALAAYGFSVDGYDIDQDALATARSNAGQAETELGELDMEFHQASIGGIETDADLVVMNPPFGIQTDQANLPFLETAFRTAPTVYALLHRSDRSTTDTRQFIKDFASNHGFVAQVLGSFRFELPPSMPFHTEETAATEVDLYRFEESTNGV